ncbi:NAD(P)-dependent oxidoreductase [Pusillimonas sp.]|uniref:NAD(P)-dependent oxidoreductase n=1 Tax=Pusillimonas sp. TaxID=3040095 RepID=UPI0037C9AD76
MGGIDRLYPLFANLSGREVRLVGGGPVAERKARMLRQSNARIRVGALALTPTLQAWVDDGHLAHDVGQFQDDWLDGAWLVVAATNDRAVNARIKMLADQRRIFVNVVDDPQNSSFQVPAVVDRSPIMIAISSGGTAPVLARRLRERLESLFDHALGSLGSLAHRYRRPICDAYPDLGERREFYDWLFDGPVLEHLRNGEGQHAERMLKTRLTNPQSPTAPKLTLIDALHGDPARLTLGGLRTLYEADAIAYEDNMARGLIDLARRDAEHHRLSSQDVLAADTLTRALVRLSKRHRNITVLKTNPAPQPGLLEQTAAMLGQSGLPCRIIS